MSLKALANPQAGQIKKYRAAAKVRPGVKTAPGWAWLDVVPVEDDQSTGGDTTVDAPVDVVEAERVARVTVTRDKTEAEKDDDLQQEVRTLRYIVKAFLNHENRIRALEENPSVTMQQLLTGIRNL